MGIGLGFGVRLFWVYWWVKEGFGALAVRRLGYWMGILIDLEGIGWVIGLFGVLCGVRRIEA